MIFDLNPFYYFADMLVGECSDTSSSCTAWYQQGYCHKRMMTMAAQCKETCKWCYDGECKDNAQKTTCETAKARGYCTE